MEPTSRRRSGSLVTTNHFQSLRHVQHEHFLSDTTKSHDWRINQLSRTARMLLDNKVGVTTWCAMPNSDFCNGTASVW
jgi:aldehyde dehydrogenase (NAD+)